jgi:hypothetical protein
MGEDKLVTRAELEGSFAALTAAITALTTQVNNINNNRNNKTATTGEENQFRLSGFVITNILLLCTKNRNIPMNLIWNTMSVDITTN